MAKQKSTDTVAHAANPDGTVESVPESTTTVDPGGYSGSGPLTDLLRSGPRKLEKGQARAERDAAARKGERQTADAKAGAELFDMIVHESGEKGDWIEFEVADEAAAKRVRRLVNAAAAESEHNVSVAIDTFVEDRETVNENGELLTEAVEVWTVQARKQRHTGAGRKPQAETAS